MAEAPSRACQRVPLRRPEDKTMTQPLYERFHSKINFSEECWIWTGCVSKGVRHPDGYGQIWYEGRMVPATHAAWFLSTGEWPTKFMCHRCNSSLCVRIDHLYEGDQVDNMQDRAANGKYGWPNHSRPDIWKRQERICHNCSMPFTIRLSESARKYCSEYCYREARYSA